MKYGYFDNEKREYVITHPKTPVKWINYIGTLSFGGFVDHTGGLLVCKGDPALNRITKYIQQLPSSDFKGFTIYIRLKHKDGFRIFSPLFVPTLDPYDAYECRVGLGYSRITTEYYGIRTSVTFFVPLAGERVLIDIAVTNIANHPLVCDLVPVVEYSHPIAIKQYNNADWVPQTMQSKIYNEDSGMKVLTQYAFCNKGITENFFTSNRPVSSFESDRKRFLGDNEYGRWSFPLSLRQEELDNYEAFRGDNIGALLHHMGKMETGETKRLVCQLGQAGDLEKALSGIKKFRKEKAVDEAFEELGRFWTTLLEKVVIKTPDIPMNNMIGLFNPYQCHTTFNWSRFLSLYQLGLGARGIGFRDSSQDVLGIMDRIPEEASKLIEKLLHVQKSDGSAMHQFYPSSMEANMGDAAESDDRPRYYGDDNLWIILSVSEYIKETGNRDFLDKVIPYYEKNRKGKPIETGTILDHLKRSIDFTRNNLGSHGLPLVGFADWNDSVNLETGSESLLVTNLYGKALREMIGLLRYIDDGETADAYSGYYEAMKERFNAYAWDGGWFIRYLDHNGNPLGSKTNDAGRIYTNAQTWPVISGFAPEDKARISMNAVYTMLNTPKGIKLSTPGYNRFDLSKGGVTSYPPGAKENGGIFMHANPWAMIAETILGNGDRAFEYYSQINPAVKNDCIDEFEVEPYVYPQNILGNEHPQFGLARNSWLSGTAAWMYQAGIKYILGIRPEYEGLRIDPCIPSHWDGYKADRVFRSKKFSIEVRNPLHVSKGVSSLTVNGTSVKGDIVPVSINAKEIAVTVVLGE
ncbi:MAG: glycosyl transferase [Spirochaetales bacterium]|nr:glycosyl transferase [Spirochaetales bacterium]